MKPVEIRRSPPSFVSLLPLLAFLCLSPGTADAQPDAPGASREAPPGIAIELNKLEPKDQACRVYLVLRNATGEAFDALRLDLVTFDSEGIVARRLAVETAPLSAGKTSLKVFDIDALPCRLIGRILLNDVLSCRVEGRARTDCLESIAPTARGAVPLIK